MKILWITNILFPEVTKLLTGSGDFKGSGGWLLGAAYSLLQKSDVRLFVATVSNIVTELTKIEGDKITYYIIPFGRGNQKINLDYVPYWKQIHDQICPDLVHIHGSEFSHGHAYLRACGNRNVILSIQGMTSVIAHHYLAGLSKKDIYTNYTVKSILRDSIIQDQNRYYKRGVFEVETIQMVNHVIGRTSWDKAHVLSINPHVQYYFCNETLRSEFYDSARWNYNNCNKYSIFLSQAYYPIKGLHQVLKAMPYILKHYPNAIIRIAGNDITSTRNFGEFIRLSNYGMYIKRLINKLELLDKVVFTGTLSSEEMKQEYLRSNVFVCSSCIENSSNSLGEAQILGVPCVASYVGGNPDMMIGNEHNLYRYEDVVMLADKVCSIFANEGCQVDMTQVAEQRHNHIINSNQLYSIYKDVIKSSNSKL